MNNNHGGKRHGAGRKKNPNSKVKISPSVTPEFKKILAEYASKTGEAQGSIIERVLSKYINKKPRPSEQS